MTHPHEALGDDVEQETAGEHGPGKGDGLPATAVLAVLVGEGDLAIAMPDETLVGDSDSVCVAAEVAQDLLRARHRGFGVDDEVLCGGLAQPMSGLIPSGTLGEVALESLEQLAPEDRGELPDREEEVRPRRDPALAVETQASPAGDAVDVGVMLEDLVPGVEHGDDARGGPEVSAAHLDQGRACGFEEQAMCDPGVSQEERVQAVRESEDVVEVGNRKQILDPSLDPERLVQALALGAMPVAAGVVEGVLAPAVIAAL